MRPRKIMIRVLEGWKRTVEFDVLRDGVVSKARRLFDNRRPDERSDENNARHDKAENGQFIFKQPAPSVLPERSPSQNFRAVFGGAHVRFADGQLRRSVNRVAQARSDGRSRRCTKRSQSRLRLVQFIFDFASFVTHKFQYRMRGSMKA